MKNDGGPAFPLTFDTSSGEPSNPHGTQHGMSLRDWFAGQALATLAGDYGEGPGKGAEFSNIAGYCYGMADAMLAAREADA